MSLISFFKINFKFQLNLYNGCHNLTQKAMIFNDIAILSVRENDYRIHFLHMIKNEAVNSLRNAGLSEENVNL